MKRAVREWIKKAEADHRAVERLGNDPVLRDVVCFHCQQTAEKYLEALEPCFPVLSSGPKSRDAWSWRGAVAGAVSCLLPI
jgi:hypothetical protein